MDAPINPDEVKETIAEAKTYIGAMQDENGCVKTYASTLAAFYTLWSAVVLHREQLPDAAEFADQFLELRQKVDELKDTLDVIPLIQGQEGERYKYAAEFLSAYGGASTDLAPRQKRLDALLGFVGA